MRKLCRKFAAIGLALVMTMSLAACSYGKEGGSGTTKSEGTGTDEKVKFGFVSSSINDIFAELIEAMEKDAKEKGVEFSVKECPQLEDKISAIENFAASGCNVIMCHVTDAEALQPYIESIQDQGIKFIAYDMDTETSDAFAGLDNHAYGYAIGKNAAEWINKTFDAGEEVQVGIGNYPDFPFLIERAEGITDALKELAPNTKVVATAQAGYIDEGVDAGEVWLQSYPDIKAVCAINDAGALGVYEAYKASNNVGDNVGIFGADATADAINALKENGSYRGTVSTDLVNRAPEFIDIGVQLVKTGKADEHDNLFPVIPVTQDNVTAFENGELSDK